MIRLLEFLGLGTQENFKGGRGHKPFPKQERVTPAVHLKLKNEAVATAYLRAAQAYMLISMPTGTSTILGVFQAIWLSLLNRTNSALPNKVIRNEKFASEIFFIPNISLILLHRKRIHALVQGAVKPMMDQWVPNRDGQMRGRGE
jgi:hypothetical protein